MGRTDLRIGLSGAKFDVEYDFDVHVAVAPPKASEHFQKKCKRFADIFFVFFVFLFFLFFDADKKLLASKYEMSGIV